MNYSEMTDFEINKAVASAYLDEWYDNGICVVRCDDDDRSIFQPCNSWADAGPIIEANQISITPILLGWKAAIERNPRGFKDYTSAAHEKPLRAAMIVFLTMQEKPDVS